MAKNEEQKRAIRLLKKLTPATTRRKRVLRSDALLSSAVQNPPALLAPGQWIEGWCSGWAFAVAPCFASALDIRLTEKVRNKQKYSVWTQGSAFAFEIGHTIHDAPPPSKEYPLWRDALQVVNRTLCITSAMPAIPATEESPRFSGTVTFFQLRTRPDRSGQERDALQTMTQDDFIRLLITGEQEE